jgi:hypothetical protein
MTPNRVIGDLGVQTLSLRSGRELCLVWSFLAGDVVLDSGAAPHDQEMYDADQRPPPVAAVLILAADLDATAWRDALEGVRRERRQEHRRRTWRDSTWRPQSSGSVAET